MDDTICYLNTDLELTSLADLSALAVAFRTHGFWILRLTHHDDGLWYATFEILDQAEEPEPNISAMLAVVESLGESLRVVWSGCILREFNIGYEFGSKPWAFNQGQSSQLLGRIAAVGASMRITLYPPARDQDVPEAIAS